MEFINKLIVCEDDVMQPKGLITYVYLVQEAMYEWLNLVEPKQWDPTESNNNYQYPNFILKDYTASIEHSSNKDVVKFGFKICHNVRDKDSCVGLYTRSDVNFNMCGKKGHIQTYFKFNINGYDGDSYDNPIRELP